MSYWTIDSAERLLVPEKLLDLMALRPVMSESAYRRSGWLYHVMQTLLAYEAGELSIGACCRFLELDILTFRELREALIADARRWVTEPRPIEEEDR